MFSLGVPELVIILVIALVIFGPSLKASAIGKVYRSRVTVVQKSN